MALDLLAIGMAGNYGYTYQGGNCFTAGTPLLTPTGDKVIEQFRIGDQILSRSELNPDGELESKVVEEIFVRTARIVRMRVCGHEIATTAEHPFWVKGKGWQKVSELRAGDLLSSHDGQWVALEGVRDTGEEATVYNLRIADYHSYFVGARDWGFSVWAHNAGYVPASGGFQPRPITQIAPPGVGTKAITPAGFGMKKGLAGVHPALMIDGKVYVHHMHISAQELAPVLFEEGRDLYGIVELQPLTK